MKILYRLKFRRYLTCLVLMLIYCNVNGQDPFFQEGDEQTEAQAKELTIAYQPELVMDGKQTLLFEQKLEEFLIRERRIQRTDISLEDKLFMLNKLREQQNAEMANILTRPQLRRYIRVNERIQPVAVVVDTLKQK